MRLHLTLKDLPMATSAELYQLSWVIEQLLADPRRIVQARSHLHLGQQVQYFNWDDGKQRAARVVSVKHHRVTVQDEASGRHVSLPYAAISVEVAATANAGDTVHEASELAPPPEVGRREDFRVGSARELHRSQSAASHRTDQAHQSADGHSRLRRAELARGIQSASTSRRCLKIAGRQ